MKEYLVGDIVYIPSKDCVVTISEKRQSIYTGTYLYTVKNSDDCIIFDFNKRDKLLKDMSDVDLFITKLYPEVIDVLTFKSEDFIDILEYREMRFKNILDK